MTLSAVTRRRLATAVGLIAVGLWMRERGQS